MSDTTEIENPSTLDLEAQPPPPPDQVDNSEQDLTGREAILNAIYDRRARENAEQSGVAVTDLLEQPAQEPAQEPEAAPEPEPAPEPVHAAPEPPPAPVAPQLVTLPNGMQVTQEQALQLAHMGFVAAQVVNQPPPAPPPPAPAQRPLVDDAVLAETVQKMQFGSPEEGASALRRLVEQVASHVPAAPQIDPDQISALATQRAIAQLQLQQNTATVRSEFPALFADPALQRQALAWEAALRQRDAILGTQRSDIDIYREAGNLVYSQHNLPRPGSDSTPTAPQAAPVVARDATIVERKRAAPRQPQPVDRRAQVPETERVQTNSDVINQMRQWRGQPVIA